jgi:hypothetical protein
VRSDKRKSVYIQQVLVDVGKLVGIIYSVLKNIRICITFFQHLIPKMLYSEQKETGVNFAGDLITMAQQDSNI